FPGRLCRYTEWSGYAHPGYEYQLGRLPPALQKHRARVYFPCTIGFRSGLEQPSPQDGLASLSAPAPAERSAYPHLTTSLPPSDQGLYFQRQGYRPSMPPQFYRCAALPPYVVSRGGYRL